jgi:hypothetical protein
MRITEKEFQNITGKAPRRAYNEHYARRADANQPDIVSCLRKLGFAVVSLHRVGEGVFDLLVAKHGLNLLVEVKDGVKVPSRREYTDKQRRFNFAWSGMHCVATCNADCLRINQQVNAIAALLSHHQINLNVTGSLEKMYEPSLH